MDVILDLIKPSGWAELRTQMLDKPEEWMQIAQVLGFHHRFAAAVLKFVNKHPTLTDYDLHFELFDKLMNSTLPFTIGEFAHL